jgi:hypothetical protein
MTDRLTLARALEEGGIARDAAEHIATEILDAIHDNVATKADVTAVRSELAAVRSELKADIAAVRAEIALVEHRMITRLGGAIAVAVGIILAAIRYLPHV